MYALSIGNFVSNCLQLTTNKYSAAIIDRQHLTQTLSSVSTGLEYLFNQP